jgi:hypothetical protein
MSQPASLLSWALNRHLKVGLGSGGGADLFGQEYARNKIITSFLMELAREPAANMHSLTLVGMSRFATKAGI